MREQLGAAGRTCETEVDLFASGFVEEPGAIVAVDLEPAVAELRGYLTAENTEVGDA